MLLFNIAIIDGDVKAVRTAKEYVERYFAGFKEGGGATVKTDCFTCGADFLASPFKDYDIVLTEYDLSMRDGIEIARGFRAFNTRASIIYVTNHTDKAIRGYEVEASGFCAKPLKYDDLKSALDRSVKKFTAQPYVFVLNNRMLVRVPVQSILYVEVLQHRLVYHTVSADIEEWSSLADAEKKLSPYNFVRCNSGYLVNLRYVDAIEGDNVKIGFAALPMSRPRRTGFKNSLINYLDGRAAF